jgi:hypothetical protein
MQTKKIVKGLRNLADLIESGDILLESFSTEVDTEDVYSHHFGSQIVTKEKGTGQFSIRLDLFDKSYNNGYIKEIGNIRIYNN